MVRNIRFKYHILNLEIKDYPDYELELLNLTIAGGKLNVDTYKVIGIADITHSEKVIVLDNPDRQLLEI